MKLPVPPSIWSLDFHLKFFPQLIKYRMQPKTASPFGQAQAFYILPVIGISLCAAGIPLIQSATGLLMILAGGGLVVYVYQQGRPSAHFKPSYEDFLLGIFSFFLTLGAALGAGIGTKNGLPVQLPATLVGALLGYGAGLLAGMGAQKLGRIANALDGLAALGSMGCLITLVVLLWQW